MTKEKLAQKYTLFTGRSGEEIHIHITSQQGSLLSQKEKKIKQIFK